MAKKKVKTYDPIPDDLLEIQDEYIQLSGEIEKMEERKNLLQNRMLELMQSHDLKKAENAKIRISYIAPSVRKSFDKVKFQEENEDLYNRYIVNTETKASIRVTIKKLDDEE